MVLCKEPQYNEIIITPKQNQTNGIMSYRNYLSNPIKIEYKSIGRCNPRTRIRQTRHRTKLNGEARRACRMHTLRLCELNFSPNTQ